MTNHRVTETDVFRLDENSLLMNTDHFESSILICNRSGSLSNVVIEPWGDEIPVRQGDQLQIVGRGPTNGGVMKLSYEGNVLCVEAWPGSTISFTLNGKAVITASATIPSL